MTCLSIGPRPVTRVLHFIVTYTGLSRGFTSSSSLSQRPDHALYALVDWKLVKAGNRAIVDPFDPSAILYVTAKEYQRLVLVAISNETSLVVLATPSDSPIPSPASSKTNSPPSKGAKQLSDTERKARVASLLQDHLVPDDLRGTNFLNWGRRGLSWKSWFARYTTPVQSGSVRKLLLPNERNLVVILRRWGYTLAVMSGVTFGMGIRAELLAFTVHCHHILEKRGVLRFTLILKAYLFCLNKYLAGQPLKTCRADGELAIRLSHGLPAAIPHTARRRIRAGDHAYIRIWASLFNAYRAFATEPKELTLGRIEDKPFPITEQHDIGWAHFLERFWMKWSTQNPKLITPDLTVSKFPFLSTAGPNGTPSILNTGRDAIAWFYSGHIINLFRAWKAFGVTEEVVELFFASLARSHSAWLGSVSPGVAFVLSRLLTNKVHDDPKRDWIRDNSPPEGLAGKVAYKLNPNPYGKGVEGAVRRFLQDSAMRPERKPGHFWSAHKRRFLPETQEYFERSWLARFLWNSLSSDGEISKVILQQMKEVRDAYPDSAILPPSPEHFGSVPKSLVLGKLSFKYGEPAGKTRWFAIVDYFTQQALLPLHDYLFKVLATLPGDATFNQNAAVTRLTAFGPKFFCYDLTAATDVIPVQVYSRLLQTFVGPAAAKAWAALLVDRDFVLRAGSVPKKLWPDKVQCPRTIIWKGRYTRGQPMGALSSWGCLALAHHMVVQFAAWRVGQNKNFDFDKYAVLGDDLVIASEAVANEYLVVCGELGIELNLSKSFVSSNGFFQFAQRNFLNDVDLSPLSLREEANILTVSDRAAFVRRALDRGYFTLPDSNAPGSNLLHAVIRRFVSPNRAHFLSTQIWGNPSGDWVDIAAKIVAPILLQPKGPLSGLLRPTEGVFWEWLQSLSTAFANRNSLMYRGTTISDQQARWENRDFFALFSTVLRPILENLTSRVTTVRKNYRKMEQLVIAHLDECPVLAAAWVQSIWPDIVPIWMQGEIFLHSIEKDIEPGLPESGLPVPNLSNPAPPQGVAAALSTLSKILAFIERFHPPFDLEQAGGALKPTRSSDRFTEQIRRIWEDASAAPRTRPARAPPRRTRTVRGRNQGQSPLGKGAS